MWRLKKNRGRLRAAPCGRHWIYLLNESEAKLYYAIIWFERFIQWNIEKFLINSLWFHWSKVCITKQIQNGKNTKIQLYISRSNQNILSAIENYNAFHFLTIFCCYCWLGRCIKEKLHGLSWIWKSIKWNLLLCSNRNSQLLTFSICNNKGAKSWARKSEGTKRSSYTRPHFPSHSQMITCDSNEFIRAKI